MVCPLFIVLLVFVNVQADYRPIMHQLAQIRAVLFIANSFIDTVSTQTIRYRAEGTGIVQAKVT